MPRLNTFKVKIQTGSKGHSGQVLFNINNHQVPFDNVQGSAEPGQTFEGSFQVNSFAHSLTVVGPESGEWAIERMEVDFDCENTPPYAVTYGAVTLDETKEVNIWKDPPAPTFDV